MSAHVVVLGGGVGGSTIATELRKLLPADERITLVERSGQFVLGASLLRVIVGERTPEEIARPVAALPRRGIEVVQGDVGRIDPRRRHVAVGGRELLADYLVVALGADLDRRCSRVSVPRPRAGPEPMRGSPYPWMDATSALECGTDEPWPPSTPRSSSSASRQPRGGRAPRRRTSRCGPR